MKKLLATILALVMALSLCTSAWATGEAGTGEGTGAAGNEQTGGAGSGENGTEGGGTGSEENGGQATTYVAKIGETKYETLQAAVDAAKNKVVELIANTNENVTISQYEVTVDLNGFTLNGGTVQGTPALTVTNRVTVRDSSAEQTGTIKREDTAENSGVSSHYVIDIQGNGFLKFESGNVVNNSGNDAAKGASLVRVGDASVSGSPTLTITGGKFTQNNFIAIRVDRGTLHFKGGEVTSANSYAIENWNNAFIKGGTVNGTVSTWVYSTGAAFSKLEVSGGIINGNVASVNYDSAADKQARIFVTGGTVNGTLGTYTYNNGLAPIENTSMATIEVTGGTFKNDPTKYVVENSAITKNNDGTFGVAKACLAKVGDTSYYTMDEAFKAQTASGKPIVLLRDYTTGSTFNSGSINRTVDLNGHTWTCTGTDANSAAFEINYANASLTVKNGKIVSSQLVGLIPSASGGTITYDNSSLTFEGVEMSTTATSGIETNGNNTNDSITLKNSTLNVPNGFGIYFPSSGTLTIDNSKINAKTMGVQVCAGSLEITGDSAINVTGDAVPKTENDGAIQDGAAISVVDRAGYKGLDKVEVKNGSFTAKNGKALKAYAFNNTNKKEEEFDNTDKKPTVTGGAFSNDVKDYVAKGLTTANITTSGETTYYVGKETVEAAAAKAPSGSTVTVTQGDAELKNIPSGVTVKNTNTGNVTVNGGTKVTKDNENGYTVPRSYYYYPSAPGITAELNGTNKSATDYPGGDYGLVFRSTAAFSTFQGVQVDGKTLAKSNYTAEEGSTVVYLKAAYLKTLAAGKHTVTILSTAGNTSIDFTVGGKSSSPQTFDAGVGIYAVTAVLSVTGMAWTAKKREN